jgi:alanine racemase
VKANGYGHGAGESARAALAGGATWLAVATASEASAMRQEFPGTPILVLGPLDESDLTLALDADVDLVAWTPHFVRRVSEVSKLRDVRLHVKLDSGMGRFGVREPPDADKLVALIDELTGVELVGAMTHFATADDVHDTYFAHQLATFASFVEPLRRTHPKLIVHAANSAATLRDPASHFDMVRCGIALYGLDPFQRDPKDWQLEPALELRSYVARVARVDPGESVGYGRAFVAKEPTYVATVPLGYGDGVRRSVDSPIEVLVAGVRRPLVGAVSMDSLGVDLGPTTDVRVGDEVVLIGTRGTERILVEELARRHGTINYEIVCAVGQRVERSY